MRKLSGDSPRDQIQQAYSSLGSHLSAITRLSADAEEHAKEVATTLLERQGVLSPEEVRKIREGRRMLVALRLVIDHRWGQYKRLEQDLEGALRNPPFVEMNSEREGISIV